MFPPMAAATPQELARAFAAALGRRDLDAALEMWGENAAIVAADGSTIQGRAAIAEVLKTLVTNGTRVQVAVTNLYEAGGIALATGSLTLSGDGHDGPYEQRSDSTVVYARSADGLWRIALDAPWGLPGRAAAGSDGLPGQTR
jgi:ketosteroid isomerase-like protein